jgi:hypothetical protein
MFSRSQWIPDVLTGCTPSFTKYLTNAEYLSSTRSIMSKSALTITSNFFHMSVCLLAKTISTFLATSVQQSLGSRSGECPDHPKSQFLATEMQQLDQGCTDSYIMLHTHKHNRTVRSKDVMKPTFVQARSGLHSTCFTTFSRIYKMSTDSKFEPMKPLQALEHLEVAETLCMCPPHTLPALSVI